MCGCLCLESLLYSVTCFYKNIIRINRFQLNDSDSLQTSSMTEHLAAVFTFISGPCSLIMIVLLIHFLYSIQDHVQKRRKRKPVDRLAKICGITSLAGYTSYVVSVFILDLWSSACYFPSLAIPYSKVVCQMHAFTIVLFMMVCKSS